LLVAAFVPTGTSAWSQEVLDTALKVRSLTAEQAKEARPVHLRATVHFIESPGTVFVQDATAGTFLRMKLPLGELRVGDVVEADGQTFPGLFLPGIETHAFRIVGHGELPKAQPASYDDLVAARFHYQRVSAEGIIRSVTASGETRCVVRLALGARVLDVRVDAAVPENASLVDARVRVEGLAAGTINDARQLVQPYLRVGDWESIHTLEPARSTDDVPITKTANLLQFNLTGETGHRVRVSGVITAVFPDGLTFIRDEDASVAVRFEDTNRSLRGSRVLAMGFPVMDHFTPTVEEPLTLNVEPAPAEDSASVSLSLRELPAKAHEGDLISITGLVQSSYAGRDGQVIEISDKGQALTAHLASSDFIALEAGSRVTLTGIARIESMTGKGFNAKPQSFSLWLRDANDLRLLGSPAGSQLHHLLMILAVLGIIILGAMIWILLLRKQVAALRQRIRTEAALEERQRIAREFHDTLEQELAGLSLRLDAAATRPMEDKARGLLDDSRTLVSRVQAEARNLVADLRDDPATQVELSTALQDLAHRQPANAPVMHLELDPALPELPSHLVHQLRMIAQEAVTNALKHAQARNLTLRLRSIGEGIELAVIDDGVGFDSNDETQGKPGHFGCMGIRERCRKIGAEVRWQSKPGCGTTMEVLFKP
jgi:signal transduction histidine kinase